MEIHQISIDKLIPYPHNPRKNDEAIERMVASIQEFGFKIPVLAPFRSFRSLRYGQSGFHAMIGLLRETSMQAALLSREPGRADDSRETRPR